MLAMNNQKIPYPKLQRMAIPVYTLLFLVASLLISTQTIAQKVNFSGDWSLNEEKSELGEGRFRGAAPKMTISQEGNNLSIERISQRRSGEEFKYTEKYTLDGKECENTTFNRPKKSTANWSEDGKNLTISSTMAFEREGQTMEINTNEIFNLTEGGNSLTIDYASKSSRGERKNTFVYDKK